MTVLTIFSPLILDNYLPSMDLSPNARLHFMAKARLVKATRGEWKIIGQSTHWPPQVAGGLRRRLTITMRRRRRLDGDNAVGLCKALVDGLRDSGVLLNDSVQFLDLVVLQEIGKPRTVVTLEEIQP